MAIRSRFIVAFAMAHGAAAMGCSSDAAVALTSDGGIEGSPVSSDAGAPDAGPFTMASHPPFPSVPKGTGPVLAQPTLVTISFATDTRDSQIASFGSWIASSDWLTAVGKDYGVGAGTHVHVTLAGAPAASYADSAIQTLLATNITSGAIPSAGDGGARDFVYMFFFPSGVSVSIPASQGGLDLCSLGPAGGYHWEATSPHVAYAVIPTCANETMADVETTASHELIEAATDPFASTALAWAIIDANSPWAGGGGEVADLCEGQTVSLAGFTVTRVWSNTAAAKGDQDPCVPAPDVPFFDSAVSATNAVPVAPGSQISLTVKGFSNAPTPAWSLTAFVVPGLSDFDPKPMLGASTLENGATTSLTLQIPAGTAAQKFATVLVYSTLSGVDPKFWPVVVYAPVR